MRYVLMTVAAALILAAPLPARAGGDTAADEANALYVAKDWAGAAKAYEAIAKREPENGRAWNRLGTALLQLNRPAEAIPALARAEAINHNPYVMYNLACAYARTGERSKALEWLGKAAEAGYGLAQQAREDADLASLRGDAAFEKAVAAMEVAAKPCAFSAQVKQFAFWVGDWDVKDPSGVQVGTNTIQHVDGDCVLLENWTNGYGRIGKSWNFYNPETKRWRQMWVDDTGGVTEFDGEFTDGAMRFTAKAIGQDGKKVDRKMTFFPLASDRVRQLGESSEDGGTTWKVDYDLYYSRKK